MRLLARDFFFRQSLCRIDQEGKIKSVDFFSQSFWRQRLFANFTMPSKKGKKGRTKTASKVKKKKSNNNKKNSADQQPEQRPWSNLAGCTQYWTHPEYPHGKEVDVADCEPGSCIRQVRQEGMMKIKRSFRKNGFTKHLGQLTVIDKGQNGKWRVVDGMHRVKAAKELVREGNNDFKKVQSTPCTTFNDHSVNLYCTVFSCPRSS